MREKVGSITDGAPFGPLLILFGLNAVDELDSGAFSVLGPEIRDHFHLNLASFASISALVIPLAFIVGVPIARFADRRRRVPIVAVGAIVWGLFSIFTGMATVFLMLAVARMGAASGKAVNGPVHASLLADYYGAGSRAKVYSAHRAANTVGSFFGPLVAGFVGQALGWRVPFFLLAAPTFILILFTVGKLHEPERSGNRIAEGEVKFFESFRILWRVGTLRRIWLAFPFIAFFSIGLGQLMNFYYSDIFGASAGTRGVISAFDGPFILLGLAVGSPIFDRWLVKDPSKVMRVIGLAVAAIAVFILGIAVAPVLWVAVLFSWSISILGTVLYSGGFALVSLVAPPEVRASAFAFFNVSSLLGILALPFAAIISDAAGLRVGLACLTPMVLIGCAIVTSATRYVNEDMERVVGSAPRDDAIALPPDATGPIDPA